MLTASLVSTTQVLQLLNDLNQSVREAAISCIQVVHHKPAHFDAFQLLMQFFFKSRSLFGYWLELFFSLMSILLLQSRPPYDSN